MTGGKRFRPQYRLRQPAEFSIVLAGRQRLRGGWFDLSFRQQEGASARLGLVIPKRLARRAVLRNRLKRLAREAFREVRGDLPVMDLVLRLARSADGGADKEPSALWRRDIEMLLSRLPR